jgi:hypothetical protein
VLLGWRDELRTASGLLLCFFDQRFSEYHQQRKRGFGEFHGLAGRKAFAEAEPFISRSRSILQSTRFGNRTQEGITLHNIGTPYFSCCSILEVAFKPSDRYFSRTIFSSCNAYKHSAFIICIYLNTDANTINRLFDVYLLYQTNRESCSQPPALASTSIVRRASTC